MHKTITDFLSTVCLVALLFFGCSSEAESNKATPETASDEPKPFQPMVLKELEQLQDFCTPPQDIPKDEYQCQTEPSSYPDEDAVFTIKALPPYQEIKLIYDEQDRLKSYHLAIKLNNRWFVSNELFSVYNPGAMGMYEDISVEKFEPTNLIRSGSTEIKLIVNHHSTHLDRAVNEVEHWETTLLVLCSIGLSGKPGCTAPGIINLSGAREVLDDKEERVAIAAEKTNPEFNYDEGVVESESRHSNLFKREWHLNWSIQDNNLVISGSIQEGMTDRVKQSIGTHKLIFP
jgi:hypothetical protein